MNQCRMLAVAVGLTLFGTGCPDVYGKGGKLDQAMAKDMKALHEERKRELKGKEQWERGDDEEWHCPEGKVAVHDCTSLPCRMECQ